MSDLAGFLIAFSLIAASWQVGSGLHDIADAVRTAARASRPTEETDGD